MNVFMKCPACKWEGERNHNAKFCGRCNARLEKANVIVSLQTPAVQDAWKDKLRTFSMKVGFQLSLSRMMMEFLAAVADDVQWDRSIYRQNTPFLDNWVTALRSLEKRGLIMRKTDAEIAAWMDQLHDEAFDRRHEWNHYRCTPAGECVVDLLKMAGLFIESDAAISKKARTA